MPLGPATGSQRPVRGDSYRPEPLSQVTNRSSAPVKQEPNVALPAQQRSNAKYEPLEKLMEDKAITLNIRKEFFQYLQRKRDEVRAAHGECSSQYRHWAADSKVWARFCKSSYLSNRFLGGRIRADFFQSVEIHSQVSSPEMAMASFTTLAVASWLRKVQRFSLVLFMLPHPDQHLEQRAVEMNDCPILVFKPLSWQAAEMND
jgi:hypothetical protein